MRIFEVLIAEDNPDDFEAFVRCFIKNKIKDPIFWCKTGQQTLDYVYQRGDYSQMDQLRQPDLILLDLNLPGINGRSVLKQLKEDPSTRSIPIIIFTTSSNSRDIEECYTLGANSYIQKPVHFNSLSKTILALHTYWSELVLLP